MSPTVFGDEFGITAFDILVFWSERWPYLDNRVKLQRKPWLELTQNWRTCHDRNLSVIRQRCPWSLHCFYHLRYSKCDPYLKKKMSIILYWKKFSHWNCELIRKLFTEAMHQKRSRVILSQVYIQSDFLKPVESPPAGLCFHFSDPEIKQMVRDNYQCRK